MKRALLATALTLLSGAACADVDYRLRILDAAHHLAEVSATFPAAAGNALDVQMPNWRTGRYEILNLANGMRQFKAVNQEGEALPVAKTDKGTWRVQTRPGDRVTVSYELYANQMHTNYATTVAVINHNSWTGGVSNDQYAAYWDRNYHDCMGTQGYEYRGALGE